MSDLNPGEQWVDDPAPAQPMALQQAPAPSPSADGWVDDPMPAKIPASPFAENLMDDQSSQPVFKDEMIPTLRGMGKQGIEQGMRISKGDLRATMEAVAGLAPDDAAIIDKVIRSQGAPLSAVLSSPEDFKKYQRNKEWIDSITEMGNDGNPLHPSTQKWILDPINMAKAKDDVKALKELEQVIAHNKFSDMGAARSMLGSFAGGAIRTFAELPKSIAAASKKMDWFNEYEGKDAQDLATYKAGQWLEEKANEYFPTNPNLADKFLTGTLPSAFGQLGGMIIGGIGGRALRLSTRGTALALGVAGEAGGAYDEAKEKGATEEQALNAAMATAPAGVIDSIVPGKMLGRLYKGIGGKKTQVLLEMLAEGGLEAATEGVQTVIENAVAKQIYDQDRGYWDGIIEAGGAGGITGSVASLIVSLATGRKVKAKNESGLKIDAMQGQVDAAENNAMVLGKIQNAASNSALAKRDPVAFGEKVDSDLTLNGQPTTFNVSLTQLETLFQQADQKYQQEGGDKPMSFSEFVTEYNIEKEVAEARQEGGQVKLPTGRFVAQFNGSGILEGIAAHVSIGDAPSLTEAEQLKREILKNQNELAAQEQDLTKNPLENLHPTFKAYRDKAILPVDQGGLGLSAKDADRQILLALSLFSEAASKFRGITLNEFLNKHEIRVNPEATAADLNQAAYHGTPHEIDPKDGFQLQKIGTGEGAQAYGWGLYFAENKRTAEGYKTKLGIPEFSYKGQKFIRDNQGIFRNEKGQTDGILPYHIQNAVYGLDAGTDNLNRPIKTIAEEAESFLQTRKGLSESDISMAKKSILSGDVAFERKGNLYTVDIKDADVATFLDWDKPLSEQSDYIRKRFNAGYNDIQKRNPKMTGEQAYQHAMSLEDYGTNTAKGASKFLNGLGIKGIRYLDQGSRSTASGEIIDVSQKDGKWVAKIRVKNRGGVGFSDPTDIFTTSKPFDSEAEARKWAEEKTSAGTSNFVAFDPASIKITHKNDMELFQSSPAQPMQQPSPDQMAGKKVMLTVEDAVTGQPVQIEGDAQESYGNMNRLEGLMQRLQKCLKK